MGRKKRHWAPNTAERRIRLDVTELEIARGTDGFLRGAPEPVVVVGIFIQQDDRVDLLGRSVVRFETPSEIPSSVHACEHELAVDRRVTQADRFFALLCAIEEDSGGGVRRAYELLADPQALMCWPKEAREPEPVAIRCPDAALAIELVEQIRGDDWVAAALLPIARTWTTERVRFESAGNDWTAIINARA